MNVGPKIGFWAYFASPVCKNGPCRCPDVDQAAGISSSLSFPTDPRCSRSNQGRACDLFCIFFLVPCSYSYREDNHCYLLTKSLLVRLTKTWSHLQSELPLSGNSTTFLRQLGPHLSSEMTELDNNNERCKIPITVHTYRTPYISIPSSSAISCHSVSSQ